MLLNGIRLDASDFTESADNNKITLAVGAAVSDELIVSTIGTEKTTTLASITSTVDSAYVQARQADLQRDSAFITGIIDSAYIEPLLTPIHISSGKVGIGTTSPSDQLEISRTSTDQTVGLTITNEQAGGYGSGIVFRSKRTDTGDLLAAGEIQVTGENSWNGAGNVASMMEFFTQKDGTLTRHMSLSKNGILMIGHNNYTPNSNTGIFLNGGSGKGFFTVDGDAPLAIHRLSSDGNLVELRQDNNTEGTISVSGSTVSYNGFSGQHETSGIATNTEIGTVVSTIDELDTYFSGNKKGQTRADHAKVKVSDSAGDNCVYGVVSRFDSDGKAFIASVGIGSIRVTGACAKGDLLESNGDGTAKVQSDDIIRSKTIGKVTIGNSNSGVKLVSCVLYCG